MRILAIDPGVSTGWAFLQDDYCEAGTLPGDEVHTLFDRYDFETVIIESFNSRLMDQYGKYTVGVISKVHLLCAQKGLTSVEQSPSMRLKFLPAAKRVAADLKLDRHGVDALAHGYKWQERLKNKKDKT